MRFGFCCLAAGLALAGLVLADEKPSSPELEGFRAHDSHEGVVVAALPVLDAPEAEEIFGSVAAPIRVGVLPVELLILNQRAEDIRVRLDEIKVLSDGRQFQQVTPETVALALYPPPDSKEPTVGRTGPRLPIPWPRGPKNPKDKKRAEREEAVAALRSRQLRSQLVAAGGQARGYLYFDLEGESLYLSEASVYVPDLELAETEQALFFFEVSLKPYARP